MKRVRLKRKNFSEILKRFKGLKDLSHTPKSSPHKLSKQEEEKIIALKKKLHKIG